jgi:hypothetical protein
MKKGLPGLNNKTRPTPFRAPDLRTSHIFPMGFTPLIWFPVFIGRSKLE